MGERGENLSQIRESLLGLQRIVPYALDSNDMRFAAAQGVNSGDQFFAYLKDAVDEQWKSDPAMKEYLGFMAKYAPDLNAIDIGLGLNLMPLVGHAIGEDAVASGRCARGPDGWVRGPHHGGGGPDR